MYTLRVIEETRKDEKSPFSQIIRNHELGSSYSKIVKEHNLTEFNHLIEEHTFFEKDRIIAIIDGGNGEIFPIYDNTENERNNYFVMTENGKTFERI